MKKVLLCPERVRRIPAQFSWIDQRLARHRYFEHASSQAWALYLFLLTVADAQGLSYYADPTLCHRLGMQAATLAHARQGLLRLKLIAYSPPLYQVLGLDRPPPRPMPAAALPTPPAVAHRHLRALRKRLAGGTL